MDSKLASPQADLLCEALTTLKSREEAYRLLEDLCTYQEVHAMAQRLEVARMLRSGATYQEVVTKTGASTATISRVNRCLLYGTEGYRTILDRLDKQEGQDDGSERSES